MKVDNISDLNSQHIDQFEIPISVNKYAKGLAHQQTLIRNIHSKANVSDCLARTILLECDSLSEEDNIVLSQIERHIGKNILNVGIRITYLHELESGWKKYMNYIRTINSHTATDIDLEAPFLEVLSSVHAHMVKAIRDCMQVTFQDHQMLFVQDCSEIA